MRAVVLLIAIFVSTVFAEEQSSLYRRALEAEEKGDFITAISLLEDALETEGSYTGEIMGILKQYYAVLGIEFLDAKNSPWRFALDLDVIGIHYEEEGGVSKSTAIIGELFSVVSIARDFYSNQKTHSIGVSFLSDFFQNSDSSALDTNNWILSPSLEYALMARSFALMTGVDFNFNEKNGFNPALYFLFEKYAFKKETNWFALNGFSYVNKILEMRYALNISWHYFKQKGFSTSISLGAHLDVDSTQSLVWVFDKNIFGMPLPPRLEIKSYQAAKLGPVFLNKSSYRFNSPFGIESKIRLSHSSVLNVDELSSVSFFEGNLGVYLFWKMKSVKFHLGVEQLSQHYFVRPELWEGVLPQTTTLTELKLGAKIKF